jgi:predicted transcriptional regulator
MIQAGEALRNRIFFIIKEQPGIVRTEIRDMLKLPNNVVTPAIKELIDQNMVIEGEARLSKTTNKPGKQLYVADDWTRELDSQNRIFD